MLAGGEMVRWMGGGEVIGMGGKRYVDSRRRYAVQYLVLLPILASLLIDVRCAVQ